MSIISLLLFPFIVNENEHTFHLQQSKFTSSQRSQVKINHLFLVVVYTLQTTIWHMLISAWFTFSAQQKKNGMEIGTHQKRVLTKLCRECCIIPAHSMVWLALISAISFSNSSVLYSYAKCLMKHNTLEHINRRYYFYWLLENIVWN